MKVGYGKKVAKKGLTGKAGKKGRRDKERLAREKKKETAATIEDAVKDVEKMMDVDVVVAPEDVVVAPKAGASKKARRKLELEQKSMLKSKGLIVKKAKMKDRKSMQKGIQGTTCTTTNGLSVSQMKMAHDRVTAAPAPAGVVADVEMQA